MPILHLLSDCLRGESRNDFGLDGAILAVDCPDCTGDRFVVRSLDDGDRPVLARQVVQVDKLQVQLLQ